ncbi:hypothetical protein Calab_3768 [Caldithrix abyssi DSM 13497]|uniref:Uncharacterized protein n=1 Tax=Caldithrix abyssi DSM 13497 TaxID=880073 RepID=H1XPJ4_CALAY|nr:hypothetical protein Calab_3768 [Caldithrix abyssi DSM 13497]
METGRLFANHFERDFPGMAFVSYLFLVQQSFPRTPTVIPAQAGIPFTLPRHSRASGNPFQPSMSFLRKQESLSKCSGFRLSLRSAGMTPCQSFPRKQESLPPFHVIPAQAGIPFKMQWIPPLTTLSRNDSSPLTRPSTPTGQFVIRNS